MIFLNSFNKSVYVSPVMEHLLYRELLKRAQHLMWTEAIFLAIINIMAISCNISVSYVEGGREIC